MTDETLNFGWIPSDSPNARNESLVNIASKLEQEILNLSEKKGILFGKWNPQRDENGNPTNFTVEGIELKAICKDNKVIKNILNLDEIIIPLNKNLDKKKYKTLNLNPELLESYSPPEPEFPALAFDGKDDYVEIKSNSLNFGKAQDFTIEAWIKVASLQADSRFEDNAIIEKWSGSSGYPYVIRYDNQSGKIIAARYDRRNLPSDHPKLYSKTSINDGAFHHVAFFKNGSKLCLYIDGKEEACLDDTTQGETENDSPLYFACRGGHRNYFKGEIGEVRIWKVGLGKRQIEKYFNKEKPTVTEDGLVGYWSFEYDKDSGKITVNDKTENVNDKTEKNKPGSIHGEPTWMKYKDWSPVENQGALQSCTAQAAVALLEYFQRRSSGKHIDASRLFLYKVARNFRSVDKEKSPGASIRETIAAMMMVGVPPEEYWPYHSFLVDWEPSAFCYAIAQRYRVTSCFQIDWRSQMEKIDLLDQIKLFIAAGFPPMFGFPLNGTTTKAAKSNQGKIPFQFFSNEYQAGHAVVAVGYDDEQEITNTYTTENDIEKFNKLPESERKFFQEREFISLKDGQIHTKGAFLIRNSWGNDWGEQGYGWLPYAYLLTGLAVDWWSLLDAEWFDTDYFGLKIDSEGSLMGNPGDPGNPQGPNPPLPPPPPPRHRR